MGGIDCKGFTWILMDFGPAVYRGSWAGFGRGSWLHSGGVGEPWVRGFGGSWAPFGGSWVRGSVGIRRFVDGFVDSWVRELVAGFVGSWIGSRAFGFVE